MDLSDLSTAEEMIEDIKMRFEMSRTFFDIEIDWRDFLVYLYYGKYHVDNEYTIELEQKLSPYEYIDISRKHYGKSRKYRRGV